MDAVRNLSDRNRAWPRWWRRVQIAARRANFFAIMEIASVLGFLLMTGLTWYLVAAQAKRGQMMPTELTATLIKARERWLKTPAFTELRQQMDSLVRSQGHALVSVRHGKVLMQRTPAQVQRLL